MKRKYRQLTKRPDAWLQRRLAHHLPVLVVGKYPQDIWEYEEKLTAHDYVPEHPIARSVPGTEYYQRWIWWPAHLKFSARRDGLVPIL